MDEQNIVKNIKATRQTQKISLERLAKLTGLTKGYLSKIENSHKAPPFSTLIKIAYALKTDVNLLMAYNSETPGDFPFCIIRKNERKEVASRGKPRPYHYEALAYKKLGKNMEPYIIESDSHERDPVSHEGEEFIYVLEGRQEFTFGSEKYILNEGDSIYFDSIVPHGARSLGDKKSKVLAVMYSYKRR
jgi:transcriptional regulator with XRE-family HTH domain